MVPLHIIVSDFVFRVWNALQVMLLKFKVAVSGANVIFNELFKIGVPVPFKVILNTVLLIETFVLFAKSLIVMIGETLSEMLKLENPVTVKL